MSKKNSSGVLLGLAAATVAGLTMFALSRSAKAAAPSKQTEHKPAESSPDDDTPHARAFRAAMRDFAERVQAKSREEAQQASDKKEAGNVGAAASSVVGAVAASIPTIGPIIAAAAALFAIMFKSLGYGAYFPTVAIGLRTGFYNGCYIFREVPIFGPAIDRLIETIKPISLAGDPRQLDSFVRLCKAYPQGPPVASVDVLDQGDYQYKFNLTRPDDLSEAARAAGQVRSMQVYSPVDITPSGPRGFDPQNPWSWKVQGERLSKFDVPPVRADPSNPAAGQ